MQLIDDQKKVKGVLEELMRERGIGGGNGVFKELGEVFMKWKGYTPQEKHKMYYKHLCHELNIYVYHKDKEYFESIVRPFLESKMEKTFVDYYLLG